MLSYKLLIFILALSSISAFQFNNPFNEPIPKDVNTQWLDQKLDHFNYTSTQTWKQRYYVFDKYFDPESGPIILYICGEAVCRPINENGWTAEIAKNTKGMVFAVEHRFYGESMPFLSKSMEIENLRFLSSEQALSDLAYFIRYITKNNLYGVNSKNAWITVGGSYPGALSAWFRSKYPHLTVGAIASSAVILAVEDYAQFDEQIYQSLYKSGQFCVEAVANVTKYVEEKSLGENRLNFQKQFPNGQNLTSREFMFFWADIIVAQVQYGNRTNFCNSLKNKTLEELFRVVKSYSVNISPVDYGAQFLKNTTYATLNGNGGRSWIYQSCTQFSYFQTYSRLHPMRSKLLTIDFYRTWCADIFGLGAWPAIRRTNSQFGGLGIQATNIIFTNGVEDPWRWASLQKNQGNLVSKLIDCENCAHCSDLHVPNSKDATILKNVRAYELATIKAWLKK